MRTGADKMNGHGQILFTINRMKVRRDSAINPFSNLNQSEILSKLEEDSTCIHYTNVRLKGKESYDNKKIYFNRDNGFYWGTDRSGNSQKVKTIGNLKNGNWYKFSSLGTIEIQFIFIYVDSIGNVHRFDVWHSNY